MFTSLALGHGEASGTGEAIAGSNTVLDITGSATGTASVHGVVGVTVGSTSDRIAIVPPEARLAAIAGELRSAAIAAEMRVAYVAAEFRIAIVPAFGPDAVVADEDRLRIVPLAA
jgi:phage tail sheath gpL-like